MTTELWVTVALAVLTAGIFPFVAFFFKRNEKMHETAMQEIKNLSRNDVAQQIETAKHDVRITSLEQWRYNVHGVADNPRITDSIGREN